MAATLCSCAVRFVGVSPGRENNRAVVRFGWWVFSSGKNLTTQMHGSVRMMGVSPGETDNMDLCV